MIFDRFFGRKSASNRSCKPAYAMSEHVRDAILASDAEASQELQRAAAEAFIKDIFYQRIQNSHPAYASQAVFMERGALLVNAIFKVHSSPAFSVGAVEHVADDLVAMEGEAFCAKYVVPFPLVQD
jgi:hypothetical protein